MNKHNRKPTEGCRVFLNVSQKTQAQIMSSKDYFGFQLLEATQTKPICFYRWTTAFKTATHSKKVLEKTFQFSRL